MKEKEVTVGLGGVLHKMIVKDHLPHLLHIFINVSPKDLIYKFFLHTRHCLYYVRAESWAQGACIFISYSMVSWTFPHILYKVLNNLTCLLVWAHLYSFSSSSTLGHRSCFLWTKFFVHLIGPYTLLLCLSEI